METQFYFWCFSYLQLYFALRQQQNAIHRSIVQPLSERYCNTNRSYQAVMQPPSSCHSAKVFRNIYTTRTISLWYNDPTASSQWYRWMATDGVRCLVYIAIFQGALCQRPPADDAFDRSASLVTQSHWPDFICASRIHPLKARPELEVDRVHAKQLRTRLRCPLFLVGHEQIDIDEGIKQGSHDAWSFAV